jgi:hypothetical protein
MAAHAVPSRCATVLELHKIGGQIVTVRPEIHERFLQVVARGKERADREHAEHLATLKPGRPPDGDERRRRAHAAVATPGRKPSAMADTTRREDTQEK